jgi:hypothetical protein
MEGLELGGFDRPRDRRHGERAALEEKLHRFARIDGDLDQNAPMTARHALDEARQPCERLDIGHAEAHASRKRPLRVDPLADIGRERRELCRILQKLVALRGEPHASLAAVEQADAERPLEVRGLLLDLAPAISARIRGLGSFHAAARHLKTSQLCSAGLRPWGTPRYSPHQAELEEPLRGGGKLSIPPQSADELQAERHSLGGTPEGN